MLFSGYHAYEIEKNYTKAAQYWKDCFDRIYDMNCAHNLVRSRIHRHDREKQPALLGCNVDSRSLPAGFHA